MARPNCHLHYPHQRDVAVVAAVADVVVAEAVGGVDVRGSVDGVDWKRRHEDRRKRWAARRES